MNTQNNSFAPQFGNPFDDYNDNQFEKDHFIPVVVAGVAAAAPYIKKFGPILKKGIQFFKKIGGKKGNDNAKSLEQWGNVYIALLNGEIPDKAFHVFEKYSDLKLRKTRISVWNSVFQKIPESIRWSQVPVSGEHLTNMAAIALQEVNKFMELTGTKIDLPSEAGELTEFTTQSKTPTGANLNLKQAVADNANEVFYPIIPLRPTMIKALTSIGVVPAVSIETLSNQFYNNIVKDNFDDNFTGIEELPPVNTMMLRGDNADAAKEAIVTAIISYIKNLQQNAQEGGELSKTEQAIVNTTNQVQGQIETEVKKEAAGKVGTELLFSGRTPLYIGGGILVLVLIIIMLKK